MIRDYTINLRLLIFYDKVILVMVSFHFICYYLTIIIISFHMLLPYNHHCCISYATTLQSSLYHFICYYLTIIIISFHMLLPYKSIQIYINSIDPIFNPIFRHDPKWRKFKTSPIFLNRHGFVTFQFITLFLLTFYFFSIF